MVRSARSWAWPRRRSRTTSPASWPSSRSPAGPKPPPTWPATPPSPAAADGPSIPVPALDPASLRWAVNAAAPGADVTGVRGLRDGDSPWLVQLTRHGEDRSTVLRVGTSQDPTGLATEVAALQLAADHDIPAPRLLAADLDGDPPLVLVEQLPGSSRIPPGRPSARLRIL